MLSFVVYFFAASHFDSVGFCCYSRYGYIHITVAPWFSWHKCVCGVYVYASVLVFGVHGVRLGVYECFVRL